MTIKTLIVASCVLIICSCKKEIIEYPQKINYNAIELIWNDEFDSVYIDTLKWNFRAEGTTRYYGIVDRKAIEQNGDGYVYIKVIEDKQNGKYLIGQLGTQKLFSYKYGYYECRAKVNNYYGAHIAFWLQSPYINQGGDPSIYGSEIDIFEYHRDTPNIVYHTIHWDGYGKNHKSTAHNTYYPNITDGFHTFGLLWTPYEYTFFIDGIKTWSTVKAISHIDQYMILSTELNGWGGDPKLGEYPDQMTVDYVRVYKILKPDSLFINIYQE